MTIWHSDLVIKDVNSECCHFHDYPSLLKLSEWLLCWSLLNLNSYSILRLCLEATFACKCMEHTPYQGPNPVKMREVGDRGSSVCKMRESCCSDASRYKSRKMPVGRPRKRWIEEVKVAFNKRGTQLQEVEDFKRFNDKCDWMGSWEVHRRIDSYV